MTEISSVSSEVEALNPVPSEQENPLTHFFMNEISRHVAELQQIDRQLTFVLNTCFLVQAKYSPESQLPEELYSRLRQSMTQCENAWRQAMGEPQLNLEDALKSAKERLTTLILGNRIQILSLKDLQGLNFLEKFKLILKIQKWTCHLRFILAYIAFSARNVKPEELQKIQDIFGKNRSLSSEKALEFKVTA